MRLLLDTSVLLGAIEAGMRTTGMLRRFNKPASEFFVSVASLWEIAIKSRLGKLRLTPALESLPDLIVGLGIALLVINEQHVMATISPALKTRDPFDRLLLAQCQIEKLLLVTVDRGLMDHPMAVKCTARPNELSLTGLNGINSRPPLN